jgi:hypothetical protein
MQEKPPDILLPNYSMLEFILSRREDRKLFGAGVLRHLVLDEIHTYQGALGSDIARRRSGCSTRRASSAPAPAPGSSPAAEG